jgi:hypothetical protein
MENSSDRFDNEIPIVFVPALMGTTLHKHKHQHGTDNVDEAQTVYITSSIGLGLDTPDLALPIKWKHNVGDDTASDNELLPKQLKDDIHPGESLKSIKLNLCCCASITVLDQYSSFYKHFERFRNVYTFGYDWRRDLNETTDHLLEFLQTIKAKHGVPAQVVSHSMGCLIALAACNAHPYLFHSNCFVGGMFAGGIGFYPMNTEGMVVGINNRYLGPKVIHTFPSMFATASPMGVGNDPILKDEHGTQLWQFVDSNETKTLVDIDMYSIEEWKKYKIGPWRRHEPVSDEMEQHIKNCLHLGYEFQLKMRNLQVHSNSLISKQSLDATTYPPVAVLVGDKFVHPEYFLWDTKRKRGLDWTTQLIKRHEPKHAKTDGTVSYISASQPPVPEGVKIHEYNARDNGHGIGKHRELMNDPDMIENILKDLRESSRN